MQDLVLLFGEFTYYYFRVNLAHPVAMVLSFGLPVDAALLAVEPEYWFLFEDTEPPCHALQPWTVPLQRLRGCAEVYAHFDANKDAALKLSPYITAKSDDEVKTYVPTERVRQILRDRFGVAVEELDPYVPVQRLRDDAVLARLYALGAYQVQGGALVISRQLAALVATGGNIPRGDTDAEKYGTG
ncbi:MAG: hypothetical protein QXU93_11665 [Thermoproteus sp.]